MSPGGDQSHLLNPFPFLAHLEILPEWEAPAQQFLTSGGPVMVLGAPDTGKSTLSRYLLYRAFTAGLPAALVDLDVGQSHLGPPTALGLGFYPPRRPGDDSLFPDGLWFIGQTSPVGAILEVSVGCRVLVDDAAHRGVRHVVINTSGMVTGPGAWRLKKAQMELLQPPLLISLEREEELTPLLRCLMGKDDETSSLKAGNRKPKTALLRLPVSSRVIRRSPEERRRYREERFRRYFHKARRLILPWPGLVWDGQPWGLGDPVEKAELGYWSRHLGVPALYGERQERRVVVLVEVPPPELHRPARPGLPEGEAVHWISWQGLYYRLVGLLDAAHRTLALGIILPGPWDPQGLALWTPLPPGLASQTRFVKLGKIKLSLEGRELLSPDTF
jgi:polynucleotide 5'-hydroxyl-kinase GRC3/NOL9